MADEGTQRNFGGGEYVHNLNCGMVSRVYVWYVRIHQTVHVTHVPLTAHHVYLKTEKLGEHTKKETLKSCQRCQSSYTESQASQEVGVHSKCETGGTRAA